MAKRLREVFLDGKWIANTNYKEQIQDLTWHDATYKLTDANTIAALIFHINYYLQGLIQVLNGGSLDISDKYSFDMPEIHSESEWNQMKDSLLNNAELFASLVETMNDERFDDIFVDEKYGNYMRNIEAVIEHSYYHLGQIVLLRKIIDSNKVLVKYD